MVNERDLLGSPSNQKEINMKNRIYGTALALLLAVGWSDALEARENPLMVPASCAATMALMAVQFEDDEDTAMTFESLASYFKQAAIVEAYRIAIDDREHQYTTYEVEETVDDVLRQAVVASADMDPERIDVIINICDHYFTNN